MGAGSVFKRCSCRTAVLDEHGDPVVGADGEPELRRLGAGCPRLRRSDGAWNPRHGTWQVVIDVPGAPKPRRVAVHRGGFTERAAAVEFIAGVQRLWALADDADDPGGMRLELTGAIRRSLRERGQLPDYDRMRRRVLAGREVVVELTVGEYLTRWLASRADLRRGTLRMYESVIRTHLLPHLGGVRLERLRVGHVQAMFEAMTQEAEEVAEANMGRRVVEAARRQAWAAGDREAARSAREMLARMAPFGRVCGPVRRERVRAVLRSALSDAIREELISLNPAKIVKMAVVRRPRPRVWTNERVVAWMASGIRPSPVMVWTSEQVAVFLNFAERDVWYPLYALIAYTGLRRGEAVGLRWEDVDMSGAVISVVQQLVQFGREIEFGAPKTAAGEHEVAVDEGTVGLLAGLWRERERRRAENGSSWVETGLVFTQADGAPLMPDGVSEHFRQLSEAAGLPPIRLHDLRHGVATYGLSARVPAKVVSDMLGHSTVTFTQDTYTSVTSDIRHAGAEAIAEVINASRHRPSSAPWRD